MAKLSLVVAIFDVIACRAFLVGGVAGEHREVKVSRRVVERALETMAASDFEDRGPDDEEFEMLSLFFAVQWGSVSVVLNAGGWRGRTSGHAYGLNLLTPSPFHNWLLQIFNYTAAVYLNQL